MKNLLILATFIIMFGIANAQTEIYKTERCGNYYLEDLDNKFEDLMIKYISNSIDLDREKKSLHCRTGDVYFWGQDKNGNKRAYRIIVKDGGNDFDFIDDDGQQKHISLFFN